MPTPGVSGKHWLLSVSLTITDVVITLLQCLFSYFCDCVSNAVAFSKFLKFYSLWATVNADLK